MATNEPHTTRRQALAGLAITAALGTIPVTALAKSTPNRAAWNTATARVRATSGAVKRIWDHCSAAHGEANAACPRREEFFSRYNLGWRSSRESNFKSTQFAILMEHCHGKQSATDEDARQVIAETNRVLDDFEAYCAKHDEAFGGYEEHQERFDAAVDAMDDARHALLIMPAPDPAALLEKIELLALIMDEAGVEDAERMAAVRTDARRLLKQKRA